MTRPLISPIELVFRSCRCHGMEWHAMEVAA